MNPDLKLPNGGVCGDRFFMLSLESFLNEQAEDEEVRET